MKLLDEKLRAGSQDSALQELKRLRSGLSPPGGGKIDRAQAEKAAQDFEAYFLYYVMKGMREAFTQGDPLLEGEEGGGFQSDVFKQMLDEEYGRVMAKTGGVGLADQVLKSLGYAPLRDKVDSPARLMENRRIEAYGAPGRPPVGSETSGTVLEAPPGTDTRFYRIRLDRPVPGAVTSEFGPRHDPITDRPKVHEGLDLRASEGEAVRAAASGIVVFSGEKSGYGRVVEVAHADGFTTLYAHLSDPNVERGDFISRGDTLGRSGSTGRSTGPHLHIELKKDGVPINPEPYFSEA